MFRFLFFISLFAPLRASAEGTSGPDGDGKQKNYVVVIKTLDGVKITGQLINVSDSTLTIRGANGAVTADQLISSRNIDKIIFRRKRSALRVTTLAAGSLVSMMLTVASATVRLTGDNGDGMRAYNVVPTIVFGGTTLYLFSKIVASIPKSINIKGNPSKFHTHNKTILKLTGR